MTTYEATITIRWCTTKDDAGACREIVRDIRATIVRDFKNFNTSKNGMLITEARVKPKGGDWQSLAVLP